MRVFLATLLALGAARGAAAPVLADRLRGVRPELTAQLATASGVLCDRGSRRVPVDQFNDNYCDCEDGSDEPGAPARAGPGAPCGRGPLGWSGGGGCGPAWARGELA